MQVGGYIQYGHRPCKITAVSKYGVTIEGGIHIRMEKAKLFTYSGPDTTQQRNPKLRQASLI